jgi:hypothetical protein
MHTKLRPPPVNPALVRHAQERRKHLENRVADQITRFAGSMKFVYLHLIWFGSWIGFRVERYPFGLLTMVVSLEAIFLSTLVMISQNRADEKRQALADQQWQTVQDEEQQNEALLDLSHQIFELTKEIKANAATGPGGSAPNRKGVKAHPCSPGARPRSRRWRAVGRSAPSAPARRAGAAAGSPRGNQGDGWT